LRFSFFFFEVVPKLKSKHYENFRETKGFERAVSGAIVRAWSNSKPASAAIGEARQEQLLSRCFYPKSAIVARL
jgi:hypothetical protein